MNQEVSTAAGTGRTVRERIRQLGFDPAYLTEEEQNELLEIHLRLERPPKKRKLVSNRG